MNKFSSTLAAGSLSSRRFVVFIVLLSLLLGLPPPVTRADLGTTATWSFPIAEASTSIAWANCDGDLDLDVDLDLAVANDGLPNRVYRNMGDHTFQLAWSSAETDESYAIAWGDYNGDLRPDLAVGNNYGQPNRVYRNEGNCTFVLAWSSTERDWTTSLAWADFDRDGDSDLAVGNRNQPNRVYRNDGGGAFTLLWSSAESDPTTAIAVADYDRDGGPDLAVGNDGQVNRLYRNNRNGTFTPVWSSAERDWTTGLSWGDYDGDGDPDLAVGNAGQPNRVYRNDGGALVLAWSSTVSENTSAVAWGDWDVDGDLDLAVANRGAANRVYENVAGVLTSAWLSVERDYSTALAWGNWDPDEDIELAVANWQAPDRVYDSIGHVRVRSVKQVDKVFAMPGETLRYTVAISNTGSLPAIGAHFTDTLPALVAWADALTVSPNVGSYGYNSASRTITWTGDIAANSTVAIAYQATTLNGLARGTLITNTALVDDHEGHVTATAPVTTVIETLGTVDPRSMSVSATCSQTVGFPLTVALGGAVAMADLTVRVEPPFTYTAWVNVSPPVYHDVPALESRVFQISLHAPLGSPNGTHTFALVALANGVEVDRAQVTMSLNGCGDDGIRLSISKVVDRSQARLGDTLTYTITVANTGSAGMVGATVTDTLPAEVTWNGVLIPSDGTATIVGNLLTWQGNVPAGGVVTIVYQATVNSPLPDGTRIVNTAYLQGYALESWPPAETVILAPDLHPSRKSVSRVIVPPDGLITYTVVLSNTGHADALDVLMTDVLPAEVTWADALTATSPVASFSGNTVTWNGTVAAGGQVAIMYRVMARSPLGAPLPSGTLITNTATIDDRIFPPFETNTVQTMIGLCQMAGDKSIQPAVVDYGDEVRVSLALTATCSVSVPHASDVMLVIDRSSSMAGSRIAGARNAARRFVAEMNLPPDQVGLVSFNHDAALGAPLADDSVVVQDAIDRLVTDGGTNIAAGINQAREELAGSHHLPFHTPAIILLTDGQSDQGAARAAANAARSAGMLLFTIGLGSDADHDLLRELASAPDAYYYASTGDDLAAIYAEIATTIGELMGSYLTISDTLSSVAVLVPDSFTGPLTPTLMGGNTLVWNATTVPPRRIDLSYRVVPTACNTYPLNDQALVTYWDLNGELAVLNLPSPEVMVRCGSLTGRKEVEPATVRPGETLTYTVIITGLSDLSPTQVVVTDTLPPGVVWTGSLTATWGRYLFTGGVVTWTDVVSADTSVAIRYVVTASLALTNGTVITNIALFADESGRVYKTPPTRTRVIAPDLSASHKSASRTTIKPGEQMTYTLVLVNSGGAEAVGAWLTDTLPVDVSPVGPPVASTGSAGVTGQVITWTGTVSTAVPVVIGVAVTVNSSPTTNLLINEAEVDDGRGWLNTLGPVTTSILRPRAYLPAAFKGFVALPDLVVSAITVEPPAISASQPVTVYVHVTNVGNAPVTGPFWVDLYVDCDEGRMPPGPNEIWPDLGCQYGVAWLVDDYHTPGALPLEPGETMVLDSSRYPTEQVWSYWPGYLTASPAVHVLYAKADAFNGDVPYSAVLEIDEGNNTLGPFTVTVMGTFSLPMPSALTRPDLAPRPAPGTLSRP